jgi:hypothetical protein
MASITNSHLSGSAGITAANLYGNGATGTVLLSSASGAPTWGQIPTANIANNAITLAKFDNTGAINAVLCNTVANTPAWTTSLTSASISSAVAPSAPVFGGSANAGSSTSLARADHIHLTPNPGQQTTEITNCTAFINATGSNCLVAMFYSACVQIINNVTVYCYTASGSTTCSCCLYTATGTKVGSTSGTGSTAATGLVNMTGLAATLSANTLYYITFTLSSASPMLAASVKSSATWATSPIPCGTAAIATGGATLGTVTSTVNCVWASLNS